MTVRHVREREPWAGEGYGRPQNFAPLDSGIWVPAPPRGFATVFLSLMLALMTGLVLIRGGPSKGLADSGKLE